MCVCVCVALFYGGAIIDLLSALFVLRFSHLRLYSGSCAVGPLPLHPLWEIEASDMASLSASAMASEKEVGSNESYG